MYTQQPKKMLIINILDILRKYTDADHRLSQRDIVELLEKEYGMKADRKAVKRNLMNLIDFGYNIDFSERTRTNAKGEEEVIYTDWYMEREFTDAELRLLIDSLLFSKHIPYSRCKELIEKIEGLSNRYFKSKVKHICNLPVDQPENKQLFLTIEVLDEAIEKGKQVEFLYSYYNTDRTLQPRLDKDGEPYRYLVNPYQMVATNGNYYLICNTDKYNNVSHYRLDRIRDIRICVTPVKPQQKVEGLEHGLNLPKHMAEHIYMFSGKSEVVTLRTDKRMVSELIDWFGSGISFTEEDGDTVCARVTVNAQAMRYWALQYAPYVTVLSPLTLVDEIKADMRKALLNYGELEE